MSRILGYARVSTQEQEVQLQVDALEKAGCLKNDIFIDCISGTKTQRPGLEKCLEHLQTGDVLLVWRLDRLGRSMVHLVKLVEDLGKKGIGFRSLCVGVIDTTTASGELIFNIFSSLAQFERRLIQKRTRAGLDSARARGRKGGRKNIAHDDPRVLTAKRMHKNHGMSIDKICKLLKISRASFYRYIAMPEAAKHDSVVSLE